MVVKFGTNTSGTTYWPNLQVAFFLATETIPWVRCASDILASGPRGGGWNLAFWLWAWFWGLTIGYLKCWTIFWSERAVLTVFPQYILPNWELWKNIFCNTLPLSLCAECQRSRWKIWAKPGQKIWGMPALQSSRVRNFDIRRRKEVSTNTTCRPELQSETTSNPALSESLCRPFRILIAVRSSIALISWNVNIGVAVGRWRRELKSLGTKLKPKIVEFGPFIELSNQNQLQYTPLLSKI